LENHAQNLGEPYFAPLDKLYMSEILKWACPSQKSMEEEFVASIGWTGRQ
jgi:hypothetical protein